MKREFIDYLRCPRDGIQLNLSTTDALQDGEIITGQLSCSKGHVYPIVGSIPRIFNGALHQFRSQYHASANIEKADPDALPAKIRTTQKSYSNWWTRFDKEWIYRWDNKAIFLNRTMLSSDLLRNKVILDAGCGNGRFLSVIREMGAQQVVGMDLGLGVERACEMQKDLDNCNFLQANLLNPPFAEGSFDGAVSIGVLHHTLNPRQGFFRIAKLVRKGGFFSVFLYHHKPRPYDKQVLTILRDLKWLLFHEPIRRMVCCLPHSFIVAFCMGLYGKRLVTNKLNQHLLSRWLGRLLEQITPSAGHRPDEGLWGNVAWNYDSFSTRFLYQISLDEALSWFGEAGYNDLVVSPSPLSITGWRHNEGKSKPLRITYHHPK